MVPNSNPRIEYSPPTKNRCPRGTQSLVTFSLIWSSVMAQSVVSSGLRYPSSVLMLNEDLRERWKYLVTFSVGRTAWMVPPSGPPEKLVPRLKRNPRVVSNGLSRESKLYDGPMEEEVYL